MLFRPYTCTERSAVQVYAENHRLLDPLICFIAAQSAATCAALLGIT